MGNAWRRLAGGLATGSMVLAGLAAPAATLASGTTITVNSLSDSSASHDGQLSLREAITSANLNIGNTNSAVQRDREAPKMLRSPEIVLRFGAALSGTSLRARLQSWAATDGEGSGLQRFSLQRQVNGGSWSRVTTNIPVTLVVPSVGGSGSYNVTLSKDEAYRFRIRAVDFDGNVSGWRYSPTVTAKLVQQTSGAVHFSSGWTSARSVKFSAGSVKHASTPGRSVRITFTGRSVALVTSLRAGVSIDATLYLDGVYAGESAITSATTLYRAQFSPQALASSGTHTLRIVIKGPVRFDVDAFAILR